MALALGGGGRHFAAAGRVWLGEAWSRISIGVGGVGEVAGSTGRGRTNREAGWRRLEATDGGGFYPAEAAAVGLRRRQEEAGQEAPPLPPHSSPLPPR